jgi:MSHA biogenesis protein MshL
VATITRTDFWSDLQESLRSIVGVGSGGGSTGGSPAPQQSTGLAGVPPGTTTGSAVSSDIGGRSVVVNAQAGIVVVRAMPREMRAVDEYLRTLRLSVERQVMLEAKIVEVTLGDGYQAGINWGAFPSGRFAGGLLNPDTSLGVSGNLTGNSITGNLTSRSLTSQPGTGPGVFPMGNGSLLGLALQTTNFAALISFLESQGSVQVLSSPRIAALNNQKAVLKVGTEEFFATNVSGGSSSTSTGSTTPTTQLPTLTVQPFFSGIALDVLPQIDEDGSVILHVRPTVSNVEQDNRTFSLGLQFGQITLPLAKSTASETDSIVRVTDGNIVAIGGLMRIDAVDQRSGIPGTSESVVSGLTGSRRRTVVKREMVVLIKPTVIRTDAEMNEDARQTTQRMEGMMGRPGFVTLPSQLR